MKIVRLGGVNPTTSRFLDFLNQPEIEEIHFILEKREANYFHDLFQAAKFFEVEFLLEKVKLTELPSFFYRKLGRKISRRAKSKTFACLTESFLNKLLFDLNYDVLWIGDNDFDGSNMILPSLNQRILDKTPIVRSYKETRYFKKWDEFFTLKHSDCLVFPLKEYVNFFYSLYGKKFGPTLNLDLDWRYSKTIEWVKNLSSIKISAFDKKPHICILCGRALSDTSEKRSGYRYFYYEIAKELSQRGVHVHLHALKIQPDKKGFNPYQELAKKSDRFHIEKPLNLFAGSPDYMLLKRYDCGLLHLPVPQDEVSLFKFQQINIPNRLFEYQMAEVCPVVPNEETVLRKTIEGTGLIYSDYDDLTEKAFSIIQKPPEERILLTNHSFEEFSKGVLSFLKKQ